MSLEERISLMEKNMEHLVESKVNKLVEEKTKALREELRNEFKLKLEIIYKDFEVKLSKAQSETTQQQIKQSRSLRQLNLKNIVNSSSPGPKSAKKPTDNSTSRPEQIIVGEYQKKKETVRQEWDNRFTVTAQEEKKRINKHHDSITTKRAEINLSTSIEGRKQSLPTSLLRGKYDSGARIVRKSRPSTTKNGDLDLKDSPLSKSFAAPKEKNKMLGTSFTGRKDFMEMPAQEDYTDPIYLQEDPIQVSVADRFNEGGFTQAVLKNRPKYPKYFYPCQLKGEGLVHSKANVLHALEAAKSFVSSDKQDSKVQPKFATPTRTGSLEKRTIRGGKKNKAPGNTQTLDLSQQDYGERWKDIKPDGDAIGDRNKSGSRTTLLI